MDCFHYLKHLEDIADSKSEQLPPPPRQTETYPTAGTLLSDYIAELWERDAQGCFETNLPNTTYYPFVTCAEYKYIQRGIKKKDIKMYNDNVLKEEHTALRFTSFKNGDGVQMLVASMPDDQASGEWDLHILEDMKWNNNHQRPIKYWSRDIMKSMRWLMWHPAYTEHLIYAPQRCFYSDT